MSASWSSTASNEQGLLPYWVHAPWRDAYWLTQLIELEAHHFAVYLCIRYAILTNHARDLQSYHFPEVAYNAIVEDRFMPQQVYVSLSVLSQCSSTILMLKQGGTTHRIPTRSVMEDGVPLAIHQHLALSHQSKTDPLLCSRSSSISTPTHWTARLLVQTRCNILTSKRH